LAMCNPDTGEVEQIRSVNDNTDYLEGQFYAGKRCFFIPTDVDHAQIMGETYYDYASNSFRARGIRPTDFYIWTIRKQWELDDASLLAALRQVRNMKLYECDWTQGADSTLTDAKIAEWATYRAVLRDVPANIHEDVDGLIGYPWPTQPS